MVATLALALVLTSPQKSDEAQIRAVCDQLAVATQTRNWTKLRSLCTPDFKQRTNDGKTYTLNQLIAGFDQSLKQMQYPKLTYKILSLTTKGTTATAEAYWGMTAKMTMRKQIHKIEQGDTEADTFKKVNGHWLESFVQEHKTSTKVDGIAVPQTTGV